MTLVFDHVRNDISGDTGERIRSGNVLLKRTNTEIQKSNFWDSTGIVNTVGFNGSDTYLSRAALTGAADNKTILFAGWILPLVVTGTQEIININLSSNVRVRVALSTDDLTFEASNAAGTIILDATVSNVLTAGEKIHIVFTVDLSNTGNRYLYLDGVNSTGSVAWTTYTDDTVDWTGNTSVIGAVTAGGSYLTGELAEIYLTNEYLDLTSNIASFYNSGYVSLGATGATPTGTQPLIYLKNEFDSFETNAGSAGDFSVNGTISEGTDVLNSAMLTTAKWGEIVANTAKVTNVSTTLSTGTVTATTYGITSDGGANDVVLVEATTSLAGLLGADKWDEIVANTAKLTNVSTNLSMGTVDGTQFIINSSDGTNVSLPIADTNNWGIISDEIFDEIVANNAKVTNVTTDLSMGTVDGTQFIINSSDGTNVSLPIADTNNWGILSDELFDNIIANNAKATNVPTALSIGTITATTYGITSDGGANDIVLPEANTTQAGLLGSDKWDEIVANTAKVTNASTTLSTGTVTATTYGITSDGGANDVVLVEATTSLAGLLGADKWDEIVANTAKVTNVSTNITIVENTTTVNVNSSDGTDDTIAGATAALAGVVTNAAQTFGGAKTITVDDTSAVITTVLSLEHTKTVTPTIAGLGVGLDFKIENSVGASQIAAQIEAVMTDITDATEDTDIVFNLQTAGVDAAEKFRFSSTGNLTLSGTVDGIDIATDVAANTAKITNVTTDLSMGTVDGTQYTINSSDGTNVNLPLADTNNWGIISDEIFDEIVANNAKVTNQTHTGDVTGATALTIDPTAISGKALVTPVSTDMILLWDATDSAIKRADASNFLSGSTTLSIGTITATTYGITSDGGVDDVVLPEANTTQAGLLGADKWDEIVANTAKVTNVSTDLSMGTVDGTQFIINSSDGTNVSLPLADTNNWGIISDEIFDEIVANNAKVTNVTTDLSMGTVDGTQFIINSSDGTNVSLPLADTNNWGIISDEIFDEIVANNAKVTNASHTGDVTGATALTIDPTAISGKALVTPVATDMILLWDATDSAIKRADVSPFLTAAVPTSLSIGTITATTYGITSDGGVDDVVLPEANTTQAGLLGSDKWDEIVANTAKVTNVSTDLSMGTVNGTQYTINSSDGTNVNLPLADTNNWGIISDEIFDEIVANNAKVTNVSTTLSTGTVDATTYGITSDGGANDVVLVEATTSLAGLLGADKWDEIVANTAKVTNASTTLSTGTVTATTYGITSDGGANDVILAEATTSLAGLLGADKWDEIVANTAKVSNATHTGDVTGATALTIDPTAISGKSEITPVATDMVLIWDATDSTIRRADVSPFLAAGSPTTLSTGTVTATTYGITSDGGANDVILAEATTSLAGLLGADKWDEIVANTAKVSNATHTGDVTGSVALTIDPTAISGKALVTTVATDMVLIWDATDSQLKRADISDLLVEQSVVMDALNASPPSTNAAAKATIVSGDTDPILTNVLNYPTDADKHMDWQFEVPPSYSGGGFDFTFKGSTDGTSILTVGLDVVMIVWAESDDIGSDRSIASATPAALSITPIATADDFQVSATVALSHANAGSPSAGDSVIVRATRDVTDDTNPDLLQIISIRAQET